MKLSAVLAGCGCKGIRYHKPIANLPPAVCFCHNMSHLNRSRLSLSCSDDVHGAPEVVDGRFVMGGKGIPPMLDKFEAPESPKLADERVIKTAIGKGTVLGIVAVVDYVVWKGSTLS